jgi:hypothetical protein
VRCCCATQLLTAPVRCALQVACGAFHTIALTAVGGVYVAGRDGSGPTKTTFRPVQGALAGLRADEVACGDAHTAVVASQRRRLYTWGTGAGGRLGHGDLCDCDVPKLVERLRDRDLMQVVCGPNCTAVVCACPQLSTEQKAALARSHDAAVAVGKTRPAKTAPPAAEPASSTAAARSTVITAARPTRGSLLALAAQHHATGPEISSAAPEWRTRTLEVELQGTRASLRQATDEVQALRSQLAASERRVLELSRQPESGGAGAITSCAHAAGTDAEEGGVPLSVALPSACAVAEPEPQSMATAGDFVQEVETGVFVTVNAGRVLRRVRFDRRTFTDEQAQEWWELHRLDVMRTLGLVLPGARPR